MSCLLRLLLSLTAAACLFSPNAATAETLPASADTYTRLDNASNNYGDSKALWISQWSSRNALLRFDPDALSAGTISAAELRVVLKRIRNDGEIGIHIVQSDWSEFGVTGSTAPSIDPVSIATASVAPGDDGSELRFDVTAAVQLWQASPNANFGLAVLPAGSDSVGAALYSRETSRAAKLVVTLSGDSDNSRPVANDDSYEFDRSSTATLLDVLANDADADLPDDALRIVSVGLGSAGGTIVNNTTSLSYTPDTSFAGTEIFTYTVSDQASATASATVAVTVNAPPSTGEGGTVSASATQDSYTRLDKPSENFGTRSHLWVSQWSTRRAYFKFLPDSLPNDTVASAELTVALARVRNDGNVGVHVVGSDWTESGITGNTAPTIEPAAIATASVAPGDEGVMLRFDVTAAVRAWQASPNTNFGLAVLPAGSDAVGAAIYSRESDFPAVLSVTTSGSETNASPTAVDDAFDIDQSAGATSLDVLANDTDADLPDDVLRIDSIGSVSNGGIVVNNGTSLTYSPAAGFTGTETFAYTIADQNGASSTATVSIRVVDGTSGKVWRIMPLGDSITEASGSRNSYRRPLSHFLDDAGYKTDFVGSRSGNRDGEVPNPDFDTDHQGHWGWKADRFLRDGNLDEWAPTYRPDVVLIHLGTNDILSGQSVSSTINEIGQIIDIVRSANPDVIVLLAQIIPTSDPTHPSLVPFNEAIPDLVAAKDTVRSPVRVVNQYDGFDPTVDTYDGVHPDLSGENKMARNWFDALRLVISP